VDLWSQVAGSLSGVLCIFCSEFADVSGYSNSNSQLEGEIFLVGWGNKINFEISFINGEGGGC
jgi:hypothetical protein